MPPKQRLSTDDRVARLIQTANKLKSKSLVDKIVKVLKSKPGLVASVIDHLADLGVKIQDGAKGASSSSTKRGRDDDDDDCDPTSPDHKTLDTKRARSVASPGSAPSVSAAQSDAGATSVLSENDPSTSPGKILDFVPRKYDTIASLPPDYIRHILATLEPISMGYHTLEGIAGARKKTISKPPLLALLEFATDVQPGQEIRPWMRKIADLELRLRERYIAKGRVARDLQMPPDYDMFGVYKISTKRRSTKTGIVIIHRAKKTEKELPAKSTKAFKNHQALFIEKNYSTMSATLREQGSLVTFPHDVVHGCSGVGRPRPGRPPRRWRRRRRQRQRRRRPGGQGRRAGRPRSCRTPSRCRRRLFGRRCDGEYGRRGGRGAELQAAACYLSCEDFGDHERERFVPLPRLPLLASR